jgi:hypothetical protein
MSRSSDASMAASMGASGGNVVPLTTPDRHTGGAAIEAAERGEAQLALALAGSGPHCTAPDASARAAGSREEEWRTPREGSGEGRERAETPDAHTGDLAGSAECKPILRSYSENKCSSQALAEARPAWRKHIRTLTRAFREKRALHHVGRARRLEDGGESSKGIWHRRRARGQRERFEVIDGCGERELVVSCADCGHQARRLTARCQHHRVCVVCRGHRARKYRSMIRAALRRARGDLGNLARRGACRDRFFTLTLPHSGDVERDLQLLPEMWKRFRVLLWVFFRLEHGLTPMPIG